MCSSIRLLILTILLLPRFSFCQTQEGIVNYLAASPTPVLLTGSLKPSITLGDVVIIKLSGTVNLRPYEVEKKKGGFLGIGAKRYKERHNNELEADKFTTVVSIPGTKLTSDYGLERTFTFDDSQLNAGTDESLETKKEFAISAFIKEAGKNPHLGWSQLKLTVDIETKGRIDYLIKLLRKERPQSFATILPYLELGNVLRQHPNELATALVTFYKNDQPDVLARISQDLYEYLLIKSPNNTAIRSSLALTYAESLQFRIALTEAKKVISQLQDKPEQQLEKSDMAALATSYQVLAQVTTEKQLSTQSNSQLIAARYYGISAGYLQKIADKNGYITTRIRQVKCLQAVSTPEALLEATEILENYLGF
ncbi:hypothetical protein ACXZ1K_16030 [Pedobacter sp. PWIIR3]